MYKVYIETSVVSYYTARLSRDIRMAAHQQATQLFWDKLGELYDPYVSALVLQEPAPVLFRLNNHCWALL